MAVTPSAPDRESNRESNRDALEDTVAAPRPSEGPMTARASDAHEEAPIRPTMPIDRYRLGTELGRGGMGRVVEAFDVQLGRTVALKEVLTKGTHRRFAREIHITARLEHASIVPLYDSGINHDGKPFYVMRKVTGTPLDEMVMRCGSLDERLTLLPAMLSAIDAIAHAHGRGVIHRDIKPQNILVGDLGETVVIDWGLAKVVGEPDDDDPVDTHVPSAADSLRTQAGSVFGTPGFMAPEQARGEALDTQGDVYALGATLYHLLSGEPPVRGVSATEVMDKTRTHDIRTLAESAPGVPQDLDAIVKKARSFDPGERYRDAGELGEDVRRFLAGQLVAAHDYTRWQKLARFGRRHRGVLSVIAVAAVAVAVMAWIGVHRIITERDAATEARRDADAGKREAEEARDRLAERHDALVVMQARAELEISPTESLAILKQLSPTSPRRDEARAIAQAAAIRGVAWAMQTTTVFTLQAELAPDGRHLVQVTRDGMVRVFDLDLRRLVVSRAFAEFTRAEWIAGGRLLITSTKAPPQLFDPSTSAIEQLPFEPIALAWPTAAGDRLIIQTVAGTAALFDVATKTFRPVPFPDKINEIAIAPDGSWYAIAGYKGAVIYDRDGKEIARHDSKVLHLAGSAARVLAIMADDGKLYECSLDPKPVWTELTLAARPVWFVYRGRELSIYLINGDVAGFKGNAVFRRTTFDRMTPTMREADEDVVVHLRDDGKLQWTSDFGNGTLSLPSVTAHGRIAARRGTSKVAVVGDGLIAVYDLAVLLPRKINTRGRAVFIDDDTLLVMGEATDKWEWLDIHTKKRTAIEDTDLMMPMLWDMDPQSGRMLLRDQRTPEGGRFTMIRKNSSKVEAIAEGEKSVWARLVPGNAVIYGLGDAQVFAKIGDEPAKMVAKVDGISNHGVGLGPLQFAVHSTTGEVIRVDLRSGTIDRVRVPIGTHGYVATDNAGHTLVVEDNRLLIWDGTVSEIAKFDRPIERVSPVEGGVAVEVGRENEVHVIELVPGAVPHRVIAGSRVPPAISPKLLAALGNGQDVGMVELPSRTKWTMPPLSTGQQWLDLSPKGRSLLQHTDAGIALWTIPRIGADFAAWLDDETNASLDKDGVLAWPWQKP